MKFLKFGKKKNDDKLEKISNSEVSIVIKRLMGGRTPITVAEFKAEETNDENYNLILQGDGGSFKENIDNVKHDVIDYLKYKLDIKQMPFERKIKTIKDTITTQEKKIKDIDNGFWKDENGKSIKVNIYDEEDKLRHYKALLFCVENDGDGSYIELLQDGTRRITFLSEEGILTPYFHNASNVSMYPDVGSKRKQFRSEQLLIDQELKDDLSNDWGNLLKWALKVVPVVLLVLNIFWSSNLMSRSSELDNFYDESYIKTLSEKFDMTNIKCADYYAQTMEANVDIINHYKENVLNSIEVEDTLEAKPNEVNI